MALLRFGWGWLIWHLKAAIWYVKLGFRLYFAIGLDRDFDPQDDNVGKHFKCPFPRSYRRHLGRPVALEES